MAIESRGAKTSTVAFPFVRNGTVAYRLSTCANTIRRELSTIRKWRGTTTKHDKAPGSAHRHASVPLFAQRIEEKIKVVTASRHRSPLREKLFTLERIFIPARVRASGSTEIFQIPSHRPCHSPEEIFDILSKRISRSWRGSLAEIVPRGITRRSRRAERDRATMTDKKMMAKVGLLPRHRV